MLRSGRGTSASPRPPRKCPLALSGHLCSRTQPKVVVAIVADGEM